MRYVLTSAILLFKSEPELKLVFGSYWMPSLEIKFDVAKYLVAKKKK